MNAYDFMRSNRDYFEDFVSRSTYHSNAIEGNTLTLAETYAIQFVDNSVVVTATPREIYEAINYKYALSSAMETVTESLTDSIVIAVAKDINRNISEIGGYRKSQVLIRGAEHVPPAANQINQMMHTLLHDYALDVADGVDPYLREATFHVRFERIHPFEDGNGRTGRILMTRGLVNDGLPPAVIPVESRKTYLKLLADRDIDGLAEMISSLSTMEKKRIEAFRSADNGRHPTDDLERFDEAVERELDDAPRTRRWHHRA